mgnify:CR=1 FL=1
MQRERELPNQMRVKGEEEMKPYCTVCGRTSNVIKIRVGGRAFFFCLRHALEAYEELERQIQAITMVKGLYVWAERNGIKT